MLHWRELLLSRNIGSRLVLGWARRLKVKRSGHKLPLIDDKCHAPILGLTRLADPNRFRGAKPYILDSLPVFFFFLFFF